MTDFAVRVAAALGCEVTRATRLRGGDFAEAYRMALDDGRVVFAKTHRAPPPQFFDTEAAGLRWLAAGAPGSLGVPDVLHVADDLLALSWVDETRQRATPDEAAFGYALAALHASGAPCFGREDGRTTGSRRLPNAQHDRWPTFLATQRLLPLCVLATDNGALAPRTVKALERLAARLDERLGPAEPPARLHGDLWAGNRLVDTAGRHWLVDPACFGGHREFDLAMMRLFGGFGDACFSAYAQAAPLADGWQARVPLLQLVPLTVHAIKFAGHYVAAVDAALGALGAFNTGRQRVRQ